MTITISQATALLKKGQLVCFPTETVYALAGDASNDLAVERVYHLKNRQEHSPLAVMVPHLEVAKYYGKFNAMAQILAAHFWPGPLTLIVPRHHDGTHRLSTLVNRGIDTIAFRIPDHPIALELLKEVDIPIVATSANPSGEKSAVTATEIQYYFGHKVPVVEEGECTLKVASTIIDMTAETPHIIRQGSLESEKIWHVLEQNGMHFK